MRDLNDYKFFSMNTSHLQIGIIHSLIGKNDGVSIVIDQTVNAMMDHMGIDLGNIFFLAAHSSPRFNAQTDEIFWHKNEVHKTVLQYFEDMPEDIDLDKLIHENALYAKEVISNWAVENELDLIIAHNTSHPYNFITAVGLGYYIEELRANNIIWPKYCCWWHDSYFERERFKNPNPIIKKYLKYLPGTYVDGIVFLNTIQPELAKKYFKEYDSNKLNEFFRERSLLIPNTSEIPWDWEALDWDKNELMHPPIDGYNNTFFKDIGLLDEIEKRGFTIDETVILLQHTRVVPRKNIDLAIDFAFQLEKKFLKNNKKRCFVLLVSGHSGDEQVDYKRYLNDFYQDMIEKNPASNVVLLFGEDIILSHRDIIVDKKYYRFKDIPGIVAAAGGLGTFFSEVEGYGNNLLEMMALALPVIINEYEIYKTDISHLGFDLPSINEGELTEKIVDRSYEILTDYKERNNMVRRNLQILKDKLDHKLIVDRLQPLIEKMFTRIIK
jgi:glycosyltransferase involved in cell wall biosynthesis